METPKQPTNEPQDPRQTGSIALDGEDVKPGEESYVHDADIALDMAYASKNQRSEEAGLKQLRLLMDNIKESTESGEPVSDDEIQASLYRMVKMYPEIEVSPWRNVRIDTYDVEDFKKQSIHRFDNGDPYESRYGKFKTPKARSITEISESAEKKERLARTLHENYPSDDYIIDVMKLAPGTELTSDTLEKIREDQGDNEWRRSQMGSNPYENAIGLYEELAVDRFQLENHGKPNVLDFLTQAIKDIDDNAVGLHGVKDDYAELASKDETTIADLKEFVKDVSAQGVNGLSDSIAKSKRVLKDIISGAARSYKIEK